MWILEQIITEICEEYTQLNGGREPITGVDGRPLLGNLEKYKNAGHRVVWTLTGGSFGKAEKLGGPDGEQYQALATFQVWIWRQELEQCWDVMVDLIAAIRGTRYAVNVGPLNFQAPTETDGRHSHSGELMTFAVTLAAPVPIVGTVPPEEATLELHESTVTEDNGTPDIDGNFAAFETVVVTGPPAS